MTSCISVEYYAKATKAWMKDRGHTRAMLDADSAEILFGGDEDDLEIFGRYFPKSETLANGCLMILDERSNLKKAIKITEENKLQLSAQFDLTEDELDEEYGVNVGLWLVADFGASRPDGYLSEDKFQAAFDIVPEDDMKLQNGFVAIVDKGTYAPILGGA